MVFVALLVGGGWVAYRQTTTDHHTVAAPKDASPIDRQRQRWKNQHVSDYTYHLSSGGMAGPYEAVITVRGGKVVASREVQHTSYKVDPMTIDQLFDETAREQRTADEVEIEWDPTYGFPRHVSIDEDTDAIDDEHGFGASELHPLST